MNGKSFEEALRRLEEVVRQLESGDLPLEHALDLFAEGVDLARYCRGVLDQAEQRLEVLAGIGVRPADTPEGDDEIG